MNGILRKKKDRLWALLFIVCGAFLLTLFTFILCQDSQQTIDDLSVCLFFMFFGMLCLLFGIWSEIVVRRAFVRATEDGVEAYASYFFLGRRISCSYGEITSVKLGANGTLFITCVDNKKDFGIRNLENGADLLLFIQKHVHYHKPRKGIEELMTTVHDLQSLKKTHVRKLVAFTIAMIVLLVAVIIGTSAKNMQDFTKQETAVFIAGGICFVLVLAFISVNLVRVVRVDSSLARAGEDLTQLVLRKTPPGSGSVASMYIDEQIGASFRYVVYRVHQSEEVFYVIETVNSGYAIERIWESPVFPNMSALSAELKDLIKIPVPRNVPDDRR